MDTQTDIAPCPDCGKPANRYTASNGHVWFYCDPCVERSGRMFRQLIKALTQKFPSLPSRSINTLARYGRKSGLDLEALLCASDRDLLAFPMIGPKLLAGFRAVHPSPISRPLDPNDPWAEHVAMIALAG